MQYPNQLLPQLNFTKITSILNGYFVCRKVPDKKKLEQSISIAPEELLGIEVAGDCFDYSTSLTGIFELAHNAIELTGERKKYFRTYWDENSAVDIPEFEKDFILKEETGWFFLQIDRINGITIPFNRKGTIPENETATAIVVHTPTNSNFWHFSLKWKDDKGFISTNDSKWKNNIIATVRALLCELIILEIHDQKIEQHWYIHN